MTEVKPRPSIRDRLKNVFSTVRGTVVAIAGFLALVGGVIGFITRVTGIWPSVEDDVSDVVGYVGDFLATDVEVWHLLLVLSGQAVVAAIIGLWVYRKLAPSEVPVTSVARGDSGTDLYPREIDYLGLKWPVRAQTSSSDIVTHFKVGRPMCPQCRTPLGMVVSDDDTDEEAVMPLDDGLADGLTSARMAFRCSHDGETFDLRDRGLGMKAAKDFVNDEAMGKHRTALAAKETRK